MLDVTRVLKWYAAKRIRQLRKHPPAEVQQRQLLTLLKKAADTVFGRHHNFARLQSVSDYQAAVSLRSYEDFWLDYWQTSFPVLVDQTWPGRIPFFALTSGTTTGSTKYIPCSQEMIASNAKAGLDLLVFHLRHRPSSRILAGKSFVLGGSTDLKELAPGVYAGDLSGIAVINLPWWIRPWHFPPMKLALIADWEKKISALATAARKLDIRSISGIPSWLNIFFSALSPNHMAAAFRLVDYFPHLEMLVHGGVMFTPYRTQFERYLEGSHAELREVYPASEGFLAVADEAADRGLRLILDHGIFFEFIPVEELGSARPIRHWVANVQPHVQYAVAVTTCAGLWSYLIGDTITFVDTAPHRIRVTGRLAYTLSAFGEHIIEEELEDAVSESARRLGRTLCDFAVGAIYPTRIAEKGRHLYIVEFEEGPLSRSEIEGFAAMIDQQLQTRNEDYAAHRCAGFGMAAPEVIVAAHGSFQHWMKTHGKLGGQHKVPRIINDADLLDSLYTFVRRESAAGK